MTGPVSGTIDRGSGATQRARPLGVAILLYALAGGVACWAAHLVVGAALANGTCSGTPRSLLTVNNVVCTVGVLTALAASVVARRPASTAAAVTGRARFLGDLAIITNVTSLALVLLESLPVYLLSSCA